MAVTIASQGSGLAGKARPALNDRQRLRVGLSAGFEARQGEVRMLFSPKIPCFLRHLREKLVRISFALLT